MKKLKLSEVAGKVSTLEGKAQTQIKGGAELVRMCNFEEMINNSSARTE